MADTHAAFQEANPNPEAIFIENLAWIDKMAFTVCRLNGLLGADAEDFTSWTKIRLMENDFAVLRKFRGESDIHTYFAVVIARYFQAFSRERRGLWRTSAAAKQLGPPAPALELLVRRDGYTVAQAGEKLRSSGQTTLTDIELARLLGKLPDRLPLRPVEVEANQALEDVASPLSSDENMISEVERANHSRITEALENAMDQLSVEDRAIALMYFVDGLTVAQVARALDLEQKPLYRRISKVRERLREYLESEGVSAAEVRSVFDTEKF